MDSPTGNTVNDIVMTVYGGGWALGLFRVITSQGI